MVNCETIRSFSSYSFKPFSGKRQNLWRAAVAELSLVTCIVLLVSVIHSGNGSVSHFSETTKVKGCGVDSRAGEPFPKAAESCSQKRREGEGTPAPLPLRARRSQLLTSGQLRLSRVRVSGDGGVTLLSTRADPRERERPGARRPGWANRVWRGSWRRQGVQGRQRLSPSSRGKLRQLICRKEAQPWHHAVRRLLLPCWS